MKKLICWAVFLLAVKNGSGQNGCFNNVNTRTTDPKEIFAADGKNPNAQKILDPSNNQVANPNHFDWTDPSATHYWYWSSNTTVNPAVIRLPYFCDIQGVSNINGACTNQNIYYYQQLINNASPGISEHDLNKLFDILPEDGWELAFKNFGTAGTSQNVSAHQPTFILYNRYTGKLKVFAAATGLQQGLSTLTNINRAALRVSFPNNDKTAMLGMAQPISQVMTAYTVSANQAGDDHYMNNEFCTPNIIAHLDGAVGTTPPEYQWLMSEFVVPYDPCTCFSPNIPSIKVSIVYWSNQSIDMGGLITGKLGATPADFFNGNNLDQSNKGSSVSTKGNVLNGIEGAMKSYDTWSGYSKKVKGMFETKSGGSTGSMGTTNIEINNVVNTWYTETGQTGSTNQQQRNTQYYNVVLGGSNGKADDGMKEVSGIKSAVGAVATVFPYVAAVYSFIDMVVVGGQEKKADNRAHVLIDNPSPPMDFRVDERVQLTGQISTQTEPTPIYPFVPGSRSSYNITGPAPMYNNILGVFNIVDQPVFERTPLQITNSFVKWRNENYSLAFQCNNSNPTTNADFDMVNTPVYHYKVNQGVKYLLNPNAKVDVVSIEAAIVVEYDNTEDLKITNSADLHTRKLFPFYSQLGQSAPTLENRIGYIASQSGLILESISDDFPAAAGSTIRFRTPYVPLECLESLNFLMYGNPAAAGAPKTYLKLICKFKRQNSSTADPIIHAQTFEVTDAIRHPIDQSQINNAGTVNISNSPDFTQVCNNIQNGYVCKIWFDDNNNSHVCNQSFDVVHTKANINSFNLTQFAYQNPFVANNTNGPTSVIMTAGNMVISGDVPIGTTRLANGDISFQTPDSYHIIGTAINQGPNGWVAQIYAKRDITFNGTFDLINNNDIRAGREIIIPNTSEVVIGGESQLIIDASGAVVSMLLGCSSPPPITSLAASTSDANNLCNSGALREFSPNDTSSVNTESAAPSEPEKKHKTSLAQQRVIQEFRVMPNPTDGHVKVLLENATDYPASVSVENILGHRLYEQKNPQSYEIEFNLSEVPRGVYIIHVDSKDGGIVTKRIIRN